MKVLHRVNIEITHKIWDIKNKEFENGMSFSDSLFLVEKQIKREIYR